MTVGTERLRVHEPVPGRRFWFRPGGGAIVAQGILWSDGAVSLYTPGPLHVTATYDALVDLLAAHKVADPARAIQWIDEPPSLTGVEWVWDGVPVDHGVTECAGVGD